MAVSRLSKRSAASVSSPVSAAAGLLPAAGPGPPAEPGARLLRPAGVGQRVGVGVEEPRRPRPQPAIGQLGHLQRHDRGGGPALVPPYSRFDDPELDLDLSVEVADTR